MFSPSFAFKCSVIQQRETVVLESMSFEALSCKGGASISICTSGALILRVLVFACTGLALTRVYYSNYATLYAYSWWYSLIHRFAYSAFYTCNLRNYGDKTSQL